MLNTTIVSHLAHSDGKRRQNTITRAEKRMQQERPGAYLLEDRSSRDDLTRWQIYEHGRWEASCLN